MNSYLKKINKKIAPSNYVFAPEWIVLGVNNVCNLHCKMCDVGTANLETNFAQNLVGSRPLNMPLTLFKTIVDQAAEYWPDVKLGYAFTEPLVYPDLKESLMYANDKGLFTSLTTNALNLKRKATDLVEAGLNELNISLDGLEKTHNYIRGNNRSFQKAIEGIEFITSLSGAPSVSVFCVITEWNFEELAEFTEFFRELPIKQIGFMHPNFVTEEMASVHNAMYGNYYPATHSNVEETDMSKVDLVKLQAQITTIKSTKFPYTVSFSPELSTAEELEKFYLRPMEKTGKNCSDVFRNIMIKTDGTAIPAHGRCYNLQVGNVYNDDLKTIWKSPVLRKLRSDLNKAGGLFTGCNRCCSGV